jgi:RNA polymerase sigma-70 factor (ECF subfamily)
VDDAPEDLETGPGGTPVSADAVAFRRLFETHLDQLYRFIYRYVQSEEEAEDLVHDVFLRVWRGRDRVPLDGELRAYLYTLARNRALDHLRHQRIVDRWRSPDAAPALVEQALVVPPEGEERVAADEIIAAIRCAIGALPPRQRDVLLLRWQRQATCDEIAQILDISPKTVEIHMSRALRQLRKTLPDLLD